MSETQTQKQKEIQRLFDLIKSDPRFIGTETQANDIAVITYENNHAQDPKGFCLDCKKGIHDNCFGTCMCECRGN